MSDRELVVLQTSKKRLACPAGEGHPPVARAKGALGAQTHDELMQMFRTSANADWRLRAMWALHVTGGWTPDGSLSTLADSDEYIRAWAVQLLTEDRAPAPKAVETFARMAREDRSPVVRLYLASALQRLDPPVRWSVAGELLTHAEDAADENLPKIIWFGVEPLVAANPAIALDRAGNGRIPLVAQFVARRAVDADALEPVVAAMGQPSARTHGCRRVCSRGSGTDSKDGSISRHRRTGRRHSPG